MSLGSLAQGEGHSQRGSEWGLLPGFKEILAFSSGLEDSPCEEVEGFRRVSSILGLKKQRPSNREDAVEPKCFCFCFFTLV